MARASPSRKTRTLQDATLVIVAQSGRLQYEALLFAASLARFAPALLPNLVLAEPEPGPLWPEADPRIADPEVRAFLTDLGATFASFPCRHFGAAYPQGNKIEALAVLPADRPFIFFDTDTLVTGPLDQLAVAFERPSASMRVTATWPEPQLYGAGYTEIWRALHHRFGLDFESSLDRAYPDEYWRRYLYFNAGWFLGDCPRRFGARFAEFALSIRDDPGDALAAQALYPWLDQITLPLVIHSLGGGRPGSDLCGLDGALTCHYRALPLLYARESDHVVAALQSVAEDKSVRRLLKHHEPARQLIYLNRGRKARALFNRADLPKREHVIRNTLKREGLWLR